MNLDKVRLGRAPRLGLICGLILAVWTIPASAAPAPVTYLNVNFGGNFDRSTGTMKLQSATASVYASAKSSQVDFSASANLDPNETSSGFSSYDIGTANVPAPGGSLDSVSVSPRTVTLSGSAHLAMNLWFDSNHDGEYFVWSHNRLTGLGADVYALGPCQGSGTCTEHGSLTIDENTPLFLIPYCNPGDSFATLAIINVGGCTTIPANTHVARWVGIDIGGGTSGSGSAGL
jgi:hypothetical protein